MRKFPQESSGAAHTVQHEGRILWGLDTLVSPLVPLRRAVSIATSEPISMTVTAGLQRPAAIARFGSRLIISAKPLRAAMKPIWFGSTTPQHVAARSAFRSDLRRIRALETSHHDHFCCAAKHSRLSIDRSIKTHEIIVAACRYFFTDVNIEKLTHLGATRSSMAIMIADII